MKVRGRILVIDDEESIRYTFESFLSEEGYEVTTAKDYGEAMDRISEEKFDLIFADVILGGKTGFDVVREVRERDPNCCIIVITGASSHKSASEAAILGAFDYLPKPVLKHTLLNAAKAALIRANNGNI